MSRERFFRPFVLLSVSLTGGLLYAVWATWRFSGDSLVNQYVYVVPIVVPFVAFLFDRVRALRTPNYLTLVVDALVVGTAMMRVIGNVPFVSGHALFLVYAVLRPGSKVTRITAALVMLEVIYLKFFVWHDLITPLAGSALAIVAALMARRLEMVNQNQMRPGSAS